jgi:hypothetical protein
MFTAGLITEVSGATIPGPSQSTHSPMAAEDTAACHVDVLEGKASVPVSHMSFIN